MWLLFLLSRTAEVDRERREKLVHTPLHFAKKVLQNQCGHTDLKKTQNIHILELHSLSVCDLLRKMVLARAWSDGFDSRASSGMTQI